MAAVEPIEFEYQFRATGATPWETTVRIALDPDSLNQIREDHPDPPDWVRLETAQCVGCPLDAAECPHCPAAQSLLGVIAMSGELLSFASVEATVVSRERTTHAVTTAHRALSSVIGLCVATSGCPLLAKFKPMARFHLPFANREETVFRAVGTYLVAQYFTRRRNGAADLDLQGLKAIYERIHMVNLGLSARLRHVVTGDAHLNALVALDLFAHELPHSIDTNLADMEHLFAPLLEGHAS
ncbi:MAG: hypothetical protein JXR94_16210 [Candidatus Hydrogenedentes bacterium]|nr:hypothetical protein [Candidatus Hydrogenedentota bacterium]